MLGTGFAAIILGDLNANIVREQMYRQYIGCHSPHANDNGIRLVQFAAENNLVVGSTKFARWVIQKSHVDVLGLSHFQPDRPRVGKPPSTVQLVKRQNL
uniref:Endonuclease/exonuclease/phosphatase domain-containing protein n=1 Tax=Anopheles dirus TaxID=7168 RepID=A0A182NNL1_9DIPT